MVVDIWPQTAENVDDESLCHFFCLCKTVFRSFPSSSNALPSSTSSMWSAPAQMTDLSVFKIAGFPGGRSDLFIVDGIPAEASATSLAANVQTQQMLSQNH